MNIISDIAGNYKTFLALIKKMPDEEVLSIGDMVDRGPRSKEVLEWFMTNGQAILGNHEHMMLDYYKNASRIYGGFCWLRNGGRATIQSYNLKKPAKDVFEWIKKLPLYVEIDNFFISHSFVDWNIGLDECIKINIVNDENILWNRSFPIKTDKFQIAGHNSQFGLRKFGNKNDNFAICIDSSADKKITGIHIPSMNIYQQGYIDV